MILNDFKCLECETVEERWTEQGAEEVCTSCSSPMQKILQFSIIAAGLKDSAPSRIGSVKRGAYGAKGEKRADYGGY